MQVSGNIKINPVDIGGYGGASGKTGVFQNLKQGQTVQVEVIDVKDGQIIFQTEDGTVGKAEIPNGQGLVPGDMLELTVLSDRGNQAYMRLTAVNGQTVNLEAGEMQVFLMDRGIQPSQVNINAAQLLISHKIDPTPERLGQLLQIAMRFPELPVQTALFMIENNVQVNEQNVNTLMNWASNHVPLGDAANELTGALQQMVTQPSQGGGKVAFADAFLAEAMGNRTISENGAFTPGMLRSLGEQIASMGGQDARTAIQEFVAQTVSGGKEQAQATAALIQAFEAAGVVAKAQEGGQPTQTITPDVAQAETAQSGENTAKTGENIVDAKNADQKAGGVQEGKAPVADASPKAADIKTAPATDQGTSAQTVVKQEAQQIIQTLKDLFVPMKQIPREDAQVLQESLKGQQHIADAVRSGIARLTGEESALTRQASDLSSQIRMGNQLEHFFYCQIPFETAQNKNTAELYVFERKKDATQEERTNITILIALDTEHMGRVETTLDSSQEGLSAEIRVEDGRVQRYLEEALPELREELQGSDFAVKELRVGRIKTPVTPLNAQQMMQEKEPVRIEGIDISI